MRVASPQPPLQAPAADLVWDMGGGRCGGWAMRTTRHFTCAFRGESYRENSCRGGSVWSRPACLAELGPGGPSRALGSGPGVLRLASPTPCCPDLGGEWPPSVPFLPPWGSPTRPQCPCHPLPRAPSSGSGRSREPVGLSLGSAGRGCGPLGKQASPSILLFTWLSRLLPASGSTR